MLNVSLPHRRGNTVFRHYKHYKTTRAPPLRVPPSPQKRKRKRKRRFRPRRKFSDPLSCMTFHLRPHPHQYCNHVTMSVKLVSKLQGGVGYRLVSFPAVFREVTQRSHPERRLRRRLVIGVKMHFSVTEWNVCGKKRSFS